MKPWHLFALLTFWAAALLYLLARPLAWLPLIPWIFRAIIYWAGE